MSFLHTPLIAIGSLFVGIPILLHLLMRRKPKPMAFPALRFVRKRQQVTQRRMRLRHLLLLMLRCAALAVLAAGLARPFVPSTSMGNWLLVMGLGVCAAVVSLLAYAAWGEPRRRGVAAGLTFLAAGLLGLLFIAYSYIRANPSTILVGDDEPPVAAAVIIDRSPRMGYLHGNQTRLEKAKELATWLVRELPAESDIGVLDSGSVRTVFSVDRDTAVGAVEAMEPEYRSTPVPRLIDRALGLLAESAHLRKEIYIFSDLTEQSWKSADSQLAERLREVGDGLSTYVIDVGVAKPSNLTVHPPALSAEHTSAGSPVEVVAAVSGEGVTGDVDLELVIEIPDPTLPMIVNGRPQLPEAETRGRATISLTEGGSAEHAFTLRGLTPGVHHGQIRARREDGLQLDNTRYFTIHVGQPWKVLLIAERNIYSEFISGALDPMSDGDGGGDSLFACDTIPPDDVTPERLRDYDGVALVDPSPLAQDAWVAISEYVEQGGSLAIILGREAAPISEFNSIGALSVLPGRLVRQFRSAGRNNFLTLPAEAHPIFNVLRDRANTITWNAYPVYRHWELADLRKSSAVIMSFTNGNPAILESRLGQGKVLTVTTPFTDPLNVDNREPWNLIPTGPEPWPYVVLANELFRYLVSEGEARLNYDVGELATVEASARQNATYQLFSPAGAWQPITPQGQQLVVPLTDTPGVYRVRSTIDPEHQLGFSVNVPTEQTRLARIEKRELDKILGDSYRVAKTQEDIVRDMSEVRRGREFYPWLILALAVVLGLESLLSNRFYADPLSQEDQ